jgi:zearalenone synthase (highly reducing iterative type I polyketide synthase)
MFSSHDQAGLKRVGKALSDHLDRIGSQASSPEYLARLANTMASARAELTWRAAAITSNGEELRGMA